MGWISHNFIIVTHDKLEEINEVRNLAIQLFNVDQFPLKTNLVSEILPSIAQNAFSFFINCDGSSEGRETSDMYDEIRLKYTNYLYENFIHFVEISMNIDGLKSKVVKSSQGNILKLRSYHDLDDENSPY
ncbi:hypothetical protein [Paenibacillus agilis]|uniref:Uncharacterized protein n=1 Tax=Paenibacillus agilis TaxID=3020863 RepID=A0A559ID39_9BACL|nr:hypothetical protein [Paenibacillus agilis]TVX85588.1 hypothetical protein FPZ44_24850 [Paenibacillus agilis]